MIRAKRMIEMIRAFLRVANRFNGASVFIGVYLGSTTKLIASD